MKTFLRKCLLLIAMLAPVCGLSAEEAKTVTFTASTDKLASDGTSITKDYAITMSVSGGTTPEKTFTYSPFRIYANNVITIEPATIGGGEITQITICLIDDYSNNSYVNKLVLSSEGGACTYTTSPYTCTWKGKSTSVSIKNTHTAQLRASSIEVTYIPSTDPEKTNTQVTFEKGDVTYTQGDEEGTASFTNIATVKDNEGNALNDAAIEYISSNEDFAIVDNGEVVVSTTTPGTCTITAKYAGDDTYNKSEASYTITVTKAQTSVAFADGTNRTYTQGENDGTITFTNAATLTPSNAGSLTYSSDKPEIATIDENGQVTVNTNNIGTATITASFAETDTHEASSASYTITVEKAVISGAENYVKIDSNDDLTGKYVVIGHVTTQNTDYILTKITGNNKYYNAINLTLNGDQICEIPEEAEDYAVFSFEEKDKTYAFKNTTTGNYTKIDGGISNNTVSEVADATTSGTHATITFDDVKGNQTVKFDASGTKVYLQFNPNQTPRFSSYDNQNPIQLFRHGYSRDVTSGNFGTLCLPYGGTISGATLYAIEGKQMENDEVKSISLVEVDKVEAGKPYIFQATSEKLVVYYEGNIQATAGNDNGLLGSYNGTAVEAGKYVISNNTVKKCGEGSKIGKNRCYIDMDNVAEMPASAAALIINFNDNTTDAIESIEANADSRNAIYDLSGRRVKAAQKGLYIVNGKKIIK